jgi:hypothetical protein
MNPQDRIFSSKITVTFRPTKEIYFRKLTIVSTPTTTEISTTIVTKEPEPIPKKQLQPQPIPQYQSNQEQAQPEELDPKILNQFDINRYKRVVNRILTLVTFFFYS